ncbi:hypothetical protein [Saccharibacillus sacchari]|uniref:Uncharacterized protein n=1 Tax=Saccharibacillus sacchari TaxID=456493 RepID=A0ACC6PIM4_9BACL
MSLYVCVYVPNGLVISADSRTTGSGYVHSDRTNKVFLLFERIGIATTGNAYAGTKSIEQCVKEFEMRHEGFKEEHPYTICLNLKSYLEEIPGIGSVNFLVCAYDGTEPYVYAFNTFKKYSDNEELQRTNLNDDESALAYGVTRNGDIEIANRLINPDYLPQFTIMNLQDAIDYSRHLIRATIDQMRFEPRAATVGGPIDTLLIEPGGSRYIKKKQLTAD